MHYHATVQYDIAVLVINQFLDIFNAVFIKLLVHVSGIMKAEMSKVMLYFMSPGLYHTFFLNTTKVIANILVNISINIE